VTRQRLNILLSCFIGLLCLIPIIGLFLLNQSAIHQGVSLADLLAKDIQANVQYLSSLCLPFIAYSIYKSKDYLTNSNSNHRISFLAQSLILCLSLVLIGFISLAFVYLVLIYLHSQSYDIEWRDLNSLKLKTQIPALLLLFITGLVALLQFKVKM